MTCTMRPRRMNIMVLISIKKIPTKTKIRNEYPEHAGPFRLLWGDVEAGWRPRRVERGMVERT